MFSGACFLHGSNSQKLHVMEEEKEKEGVGQTGFLISIAKQAVEFPQS